MRRRRGRASGGTRRGWRKLRALSADISLLRAPRERRLRGFVHSVFERVVNVENEAGELFTLACRDLDNAPDTMIVDAAGFRALGIECGDRVDAAASDLAIAGRIRIALDGARTWEAALPYYPRDPTRLDRNLPRLREKVAGLAFGAGAEATSAFTSKMPVLIARRTGMLRDALAARDAGAARRHGAALVGLGPGLTPSGDDYLVGLFAALHMPGHPCGDMTGVCTAIAADCHERTHAISAAALKAAARGRVRESVNALLHALVQGGADRVMAALAPVLAIGSTSGADMVAGILDGFDVAAAPVQV